MKSKPLIINGVEYSLETICHISGIENKGQFYIILEFFGKNGKLIINVNDKEEYYRILRNY